MSKGQLERTADLSITCFKKWDGFSCLRCLGKIKTNSNSGQNSFLADGSLVK